MRSIRGRLQLRFAAIVVVSFALAAGTTQLMFRRAMIQEFDALLGTKARTLALLAERKLGGVEFEFHEHDKSDITAAFDHELYEAWDDTGRILAASGHGRGILPHLRSDSLNSPKFSSITLPDGRTARAVALRFVPEAEDSQIDGSGHLATSPLHRTDSRAKEATLTVNLVVARDTIAMHRSLQRLAWRLGGVCTATVGILLFTLGGIVRRGLEPLSALSSQIGDIRETNLHARLTTDRAPAELISVIHGFNDLLARVEQAIGRERTFLSDVAHELRTPFTGLLATIEVALSRRRSAEEYRHALEACEGILQGTWRLIETLLALVRLDSGVLELATSSLVFDRVAEEEWTKVVSKAVDKNVVVTVHGPRGITLAASPDQLRLLLSNLFDNAVEYVDPRGIIDIEWYESDRGLTLNVTNTCAALSAADVEQVFDRFWRADTARSDTGAHFGLGLALAKRVVETLNGRIVASLDNNKFTISVNLLKG